MSAAMPRLARVRCPIPYASATYESALERTRNGSSYPFSSADSSAVSSVFASTSSTPIAIAGQARQEDLFADEQLCTPLARSSSVFSLHHALLQPAHTAPPQLYIDHYVPTATPAAVARRQSECMKSQVSNLLSCFTATTTPRKTKRRASVADCGTEELAWYADAQLQLQPICL